jgi:hypothetical protein
MKSLGLLLFCFLSSYSAQATEISETFFSRAAFDSGTAIWNQALGRLHSTLRVMNYKVGFTPLDFSVGDGSDGDFDVSTYANFGTVSGSTLRLDTDAHPILNVTNFHLAAGWTLQPVGSNPLIIRSLSDVTIEGNISCQGDNGADSMGTIPGAGGAGRCGGQDGGNGGAPSEAGLSGGNAAVNVTGGQGGNFNGGAAVAGGGGGSWSGTSPSTNGANSSGAGGQAGASFSDPEFITLAGGAGGGGGSGTTTRAGGGGGAGGGAVVITAVRDFNLGASPSSTTGFIYVNGGAGGDSLIPGGAHTLDIGGAGGGGGGGSVQVFVGGTINIYNTDGTGASQGLSGAGGQNINSDDGGNGSVGRSWFSSVNYNGIGFYTPAEEAPVTPGDVEFSSAPETIISRSIDVGSSAPTFTSMGVLPLSADFLVEVSGSSDNFVSDDSGWLTNPVLLNGKRYFKFRITITTSNVSTPDMVSALNIFFTPNVSNNFNFAGAGCGRTSAPTSPWGPSPLLFVLLFLWLKFQAQQKRSRN